MVRYGLVFALAACSSSTTLGSDTPCGDAQARSRYPACVATTKQPDCEAAGGAWAGSVCRCPTGQGDCVCQSTADCLAGCSNSTKVVGPSDSCAGVGLRCEPTNQAVLGCACRYWHAGSVEAVCVD